MDTSPTETTATALATWLVLLQDAGRGPVDTELAAACADVMQALAGDGDPDGPGHELVALVAGRLGGTDAAAVAAFLLGAFAEGVAESMEQGSREERLHALRRWQFHHGTPWLAEVADRTPTGLGTVWVVVERVVPEVTVMDPTPWDDVDDERSFSPEEFMVRWELAGGASFRVA